jgi:hypothetical protein
VKLIQYKFGAPKCFQNLAESFSGEMDSKISNLANSSVAEYTSKEVNLRYIPKLDVATMPGLQLSHFITRWIAKHVFQPTYTGIVVPYHPASSLSVSLSFSPLLRSGSWI